MARQAGSFSPLSAKGQVRTTPMDDKPISGRHPPEKSRDIPIARPDPNWKYVNLRRYLAHLEQSLEKGTQWAVFEPNGDALWARLRTTIEDFLFNEWKSGALMGSTPEEAYFVRCDRTTMTQNDLDNG